MPLATFPAVRMRRLRKHAGIRELVRNTELSIRDVIYPVFVRPGKNLRKPIKSMPGQCQLSPDELAITAKEATSRGVKAILIFGVVDEADKDAKGACGYADNNIVVEAIKAVKDVAPELVVMTDVCLCDYTDHAHCGIVAGEQICNDPTLELLQKMAVSHARAGADVVAPSGTMDGVVQALRSVLDSEGFSNTLILSYAVKFASSMYGPFRDALESVPRFGGDRRSYQMDPASAYQSLREARLDVLEGADMLMVKPALPYLDVIQDVKTTFPGMPLVAYQVSGEYSMIKAAASNGWIDEDRVVLESLLSIKRAGAEIILTYYAMDLAAWLD